MIVVILRCWCYCQCQADRVGDYPPLLPYIAQCFQSISDYWASKQKAAQPKNIGHTPILWCSAFLVCQAANLSYLE